MAASAHVIIDGNNLLYAMHEHAPLPAMGRETLVRVVSRWAGGHADKVTLVFDGPSPRDGLARQMLSSRIIIKFSAPDTADDVIVSMIRKVRQAGGVRVITSDTAIAHEAKARRCNHTGSVEFVHEMFRHKPPSHPKGVTPQPHESDKPAAPSEVSTDDWLKFFGLDDS